MNSSSTPKPRIAVVCFQLGGPDSLEAVQPFLTNLFSDPDIFDFPGSSVFGKPLARFIAKRRAPISAANYAKIGGRSPILQLTHRQTAALQTRLTDAGIDARVFTAMRYWHPFTAAVVHDVRLGRFDRILLLPLYPHFSRSTTLSSLNEWRRECRRQGLDIPTSVVCCYPRHEGFISALVENINTALSRFGAPPQADIDIVFSAHGVPESYIKSGDPYQLQIEETVRAVVARGGWSCPNHLAFQSKVGPMKWLKPSLVESVERLARSGRKRLLIVPVAFVTDHIETLHELDIELRKEAKHWGVEQMELMPALNDHPAFIGGLADLVLQQLQTGEDRSNVCTTLWSEKNDRARPGLCPWMVES